MGYESLHIMELLSYSITQVDDVIPILLPAVYCGFGRCGSHRLTWWHYFLMDYSSCGFQQFDNIGITSSTFKILMYVQA